MRGTSKAQWEYIYQSVPVSQIPWETGEPAFDLLSLLEKDAMRVGMKVLDAGCGLGTQTRYLAQKGISATGIDISQTAIKKAQEEQINEQNRHLQRLAKFVVGDVCKMPFSNASFDFIYDRGCYHHLTLTERRHYIKEVNRVLAVNGMMHMLVFTGTLEPKEVIDLFLSTFQVLEAYEDGVFDHTTSKYLPVHIVRFKKIK